MTVKIFETCLDESDQAVIALLNYDEHHFVLLEDYENLQWESQSREKDLSDEITALRREKEDIRRHEVRYNRIEKKMRAMLNTYEKISSEHSVSAGVIRLALAILDSGQSLTEDAPTPDAQEFAQAADGCGLRG